MLIEFHVIQDHGPSNMNRDKEGRPKTAFYAGTLRLRVSSQCRKRTFRQPNPAGRDDAEPGIFEKTVGSSHFGVRTKLLPEKVADAWKKQHGDDAPFIEGIKAAVSIVAKKDGKQDETKADGLVRTPQAIYLDLDREVARIVDVLNSLYGKGELESLADESQVFADHLKDAAESLGWDGKPADVTKILAWVSVRDSEKWPKLGQLLEQADIPVPPSGVVPEQSSEELVPSYELAHGLVELLIRLEEEDAPAATTLRELFKPPKGKTTSSRKKSLADLLEVTADHPVSAADIALFGRMTTSDAFRDVEAACQVADAISTHRVDIEDDYFTTVDDLDTGTGAAHVGESQFSSAVFYQNLAVDYDALLRNLGAHIPKGKENDQALKKIAAEAPEIASKAIEGLLRAIMHNVPSGKINSHAHNQQPSLILVEVKPQHLATNYLTAFHDPARAGEREDGSVETLLTDSVRKLLTFARYRDKKLSIAGTRRFLFTFDPATEAAIDRLRENLKEGNSGRLTDDEFFRKPALTTCETFEDLVAAVNSAVREGGAQ